MSVSRRAFGDVKNLVGSFATPSTAKPTAKESIVQHQMGKTHIIIDPDMRATYLPLEDHYEEIREEWYRMTVENFIPLEDDCIMDKENAYNIFVELEEEEFDVLAGRS